MAVTSESEWTGRRILIVDSDLDFLAWAERTLRDRCAAEVRCTMVGADVMTILAGFAADAVVLDMDLDGGALPVLDRIRDRKQSPNADVPVVLRASVTDADRLREACKTGIESIFRKPVDADTLIKRIGTAIFNRRRLIAIGNYFGPDRRRTGSPYGGPERRKRAADSTGSAALPPASASAAPKPDGGAAERAAPVMLSDEMRRAIIESDKESDAPPAEDLDILRVLDDHAQWLKTVGQAGNRAVLNGRDLFGVSLVRADLTKADLRRTILSQADGRRAVFEGADLTKATLSRADLTGANFSLAKLRFADLGAAILDGARFRGADLSAADLREARLKAADLAGAILLSADLRSADLSTVIGLTQDQLNKANVDATTRLPKGLRLPRASDSNT